MSKLDVNLDDNQEEVTKSVLPEGNAEDLFAELVGEGKRYKTPAELAKAKAEADKHIKQIEAENAEARRIVAEQKAELDRMKGAESAIAKLTAAQQNKGDSPVLDEKVIDERIQAHEKQQRLQRNLSKSEDALIEKHGGDAEAAKAALATKAAELETTPKQLLKTAMENPAMFATLMGLTKGPSGSAGGKPESEVDSEKLKNSGTGGPREGTYAWYQELRKADPARYLSREIQAKLNSDAVRLGPDFYKP